MGGLMTVAERMLGSEKAAKAVSEHSSYLRKEGLFARAIPWTDIALDEPAYAWWLSYGASTPTLQELAIKVLAQVSSACACERNWSDYDFIHSKKRNCLGSKRAEDLVYVFTNRRLLSNVMTIGYQEEAVPWADDEDSDEE